MKDQIITPENQSPSSHRKNLTAGQEPNHRRNPLPVLLSTMILLTLMTSLASCATLARGTAADRGITVSASGTVTVAPDMARITISLGKTSPTTAEAQQEVAAMARRTLEILTANGVKEKDIQTRTLNFSPEYEWTDNGRRLIGQRANQTLIAAVRGINRNNTALPAIIDQLAQIDGIQLDNIAFEVQDPESHTAKARQIAYEKARRKAQQLAELSGQTLGKALRIQENTPYSNYAPTMAFARAEAADTPIPTGEMEVSSELTILYQLK